MRKYCVFWLPRIFHVRTLLPAVGDNELTTKISDDVNPDVVHIVGVKFVPRSPEYENFDIVISSHHNITKHTSTQGNVELVLHWADSSHNGLIKYWYEDEAGKDIELRFIHSALPNAIYHFIKGFFHRHEYHPGDSDSILSAYISDSDVDIKSIDNEALLHYLSLYSKKFQSYYRLAKVKVNFLDMMLNNPDDYYAAYIDKHKALDRFCRNALGEVQYYRSLAGSWYNNTHLPRLEYRRHLRGRHGHWEEMRKSLYREALNTDQAISGIRFVKSHNEDLYTHKHSAYTARMLKELKDISDSNDAIRRKSNVIAVVSLACGVISLALGAWSIWLALH